MTATSVATVVSFTHPLPRHRRRPVTAAAPALDVGAAVTRLRRIQATLPSSAVHFAVSAGPEAGLLS
ncbi:MAG: hypothetical protein HOQ22_18175, partial [Nocardioidaceae bacterium]|nr:hypothetical protein [Nocardioidaceae bacterium]